MPSVDNSFDGLRDSVIQRQCVAEHNQNGAIMAKRKKGSKVQKRAKLRKNSAKRGKAHKAALAKTVAKAKPKRAPVKKAQRRIKQPVAPAVETVAAEMIDQPVAVTDEASTSPAV